MEKIEQFKQSLEQEKEPIPKKRIFIEIGTNALPLAVFDSGKLKENEIYIGLDISSENIKEAKEFTRQVKEDTKNIYFLQADAANLPLKENSADEIFFGNVLGDPRINEEKKEKFLQQAKRALKKEGVIIIKETNTPLGFRDLKKIFEDQNLTIKKIFTLDSPDWEAQISCYSFDKEVEIMDRDSYLLFLRPEEK